MKIVQDKFLLSEGSLGNSKIAETVFLLEAVKTKVFNGGHISCQLEIFQNTIERSVQ